MTAIDSLNAAAPRFSRMSFFRRRRRDESWKEMQQRLVDETSNYLTDCLERPELATRIPVVKAGTVRFPRSLTPAFWGRLLWGD